MHGPAVRDMKEIVMILSFFCVLEDVFRDEHSRRRAQILLYAQRRYSLLTVREIAERYGRRFLGGIDGSEDHPAEI